MHKLLLADSSPMMHRIVELTFAQEPVQVVAVSDGEDAIARIPVEKPDIVLADHALPGRSGYEVAAFVKGRADLAHVPVLLLSGAFEPVDQIRAAKAGSDGVVVKPFEPKALVERVRELIERPRPVAASAPPSASRGPAPDQEDARRLGAEASAERARLRGALDEYFDDLDTALGHLGREPGGIWEGVAPRSEPAQVRPLRPAAGAPVPEDPRVPTLDSVLGRREEPEAAESEAAAVAAAIERLRHASVPPATADTIEAERDAGREDVRNRLRELDELTEALRAITGGARQEAPAQAQVETPAPSHVSAPVPVPVPDTVPPAPPERALEVSDALVEALTRRVLESLTPDRLSELLAAHVRESAAQLLREELERLRGDGGEARSTMNPND